MPDYLERAYQGHGSLGGPTTDRPKIRPDSGRLAELQELAQDIENRVAELLARLHTRLDRIGAPNPPQEQPPDPAGGAVGRNTNSEMPALDHLQEQLNGIRRDVRGIEYQASRLEQL